MFNGNSNCVLSFVFEPRGAKADATNVSLASFIPRRLGTLSLVSLTLHAVAIFGAVFISVTVRLASLSLGVVPGGSFCSTLSRTHVIFKAYGVDFRFAEVMNVLKVYLNFAYKNSSSVGYLHFTFCFAYDIIPHLLPQHPSL